MIIEKEIIIQTNIAKAWQVLGIQFADAQRWASAVNHSEGSGPSFNGATCTERGCSTSMGALKEKLIQFSGENHLLSYQVTEGMPGMVKYATNTWQLFAIDHNLSKLKMRMDIQINGLLGTLMQPMMKMQMGKMGRELLEDFKFYLENDKPHPRKLKARARYKHTH